MALNDQIMALEDMSTEQLYAEQKKVAKEAKTLPAGTELEDVKHYFKHIKAEISWRKKRGLL